jgi:aryl-phospho-beta-D-glucosidase BglC (GH1 family)
MGFHARGSNSGMLGVFLPFRRGSVQLQTVNITTRKHMINRMRLRAMMLVFPAVLLALANPSSSKAEDVFQQNNLLGRGVNLLGWDAIWDNPARSRFEAIDFRLIREAGFNHVRVNLHPLRDGKPDPIGKLREGFFKTMDWAVDHALSNQLMVILDFHDDLAISPVSLPENPSMARSGVIQSCHLT